MGKKKVFYLDPDERKWTMEDLGLHWNDFKVQPLVKKKIEGTFLAIRGKIIKAAILSNHCSMCLDSLKYNDEFDSSYCESCNEWLELACEDPLCEYCLGRPGKPSDC